MKSDGGLERGGGGGGATSCQVSPHFKLLESTITVSAARHRGAAGEPCCTRLRIKHYRAAVMRRAIALLLLHKHFFCHQMFADAR